VSRIGVWDCTNVDCASHHEIIERPFKQDRRPNCPSCRKHLRLIRVRTPMSDAVKARLRERA